MVPALFLIGTWRARNRDLPAGRQVVGLILLLLVFSGLVLATGLAVETGARQARLVQIRQARQRDVRAANEAPHVHDVAAAGRQAQVEAELLDQARHPAPAPRQPHWIGMKAGHATALTPSHRSGPTR